MPYSFGGTVIGHPLEAHNENSLSSGPRRAMLRHDMELIEKIAHWRRLSEQKSRLAKPSPTVAIDILE